MKREDIEKTLKENGVAEDKIKTVLDSIMAENGRDIEAEKTKLTAKEGELTKANETIQGLQGDIKKFDGVDVETLKQSAVDWETKYNTDIAAEQAKAKNLERTFTLKESLRNVGVADPDYIIFKQGGIEKFAFGEDGKAIGLDEILKPHKETSPSLFKEKSEGTTVTVNSGGTHGGSGETTPPTLKAALAEVYK